MREQHSNGEHHEPNRDLVGKVRPRSRRWHGEMPDNAERARSARQASCRFLKDLGNQANDEENAQHHIELIHGLDSRAATSNPDPSSNHRTNEKEAERPRNGTRLRASERR